MKNINKLMLTCMMLSLGSIGLYAYNNPIKLANPMKVITPGVTETIQTLSTDSMLGNYTYQGNFAIVKSKNSTPVDQQQSYKFINIVYGSPFSTSVPAGLTYIGTFTKNYCPKKDKSCFAPEEPNTKLFGQLVM